MALAPKGAYLVWKDAMDRLLVTAFLRQVQVFSRCMSPGTFARLVVVMVGWVLTGGDHAVTAALVEMGVPGRLHHEQFHRVFSRARWCADQLGRVVAHAIRAACPDDEPIGAALDDTVNPGKGPDVYGLSTHVDAVRSTRKHRVFCFGLCWVVLAIVVKVPFSNRSWALPVLFRLYISKSVCEKKGFEYRKKTELGAEMLALLSGWFPRCRIEVSMDSAYANATIGDTLPSNVVVFGRMRADAVLTAPFEPSTGPRGRGRPRKYGKRLPTPDQIAKDSKLPWREDNLRLYGRAENVRFKAIQACWPRAFGARLLSIVIREVTTGKMGVQVFFSTDPSVALSRAARVVLPRYARRWGIGQMFRDLRQYMGFGDSQARKPKAVLRTTPFIGLTFSLLVLWFAEHAMDAARIPFRPWYHHKRNLSIQDILATARFVLRPYAPFLVEACLHDNLHRNQTPPPAPRAAALARRSARVTTAPPRTALSSARPARRNPSLKWGGLFERGLGAKK